ncbi:MAG: hypothetical protein GX943_00320 [Candidatus Pacebacteria bacterium]|jgi:hypothetical protein|nr:hypothetical protein [Candidatus Paceibacterota bacterium]
MKSELIITIIFVAFITVIFSYLAYRQKKSAWEGVLFKKRFREDDESGQISCVLIYKCTDGKKHKIRIQSKAEFDKWQVGDKAVKKSGEYFPKKV